MPFLHRAPLSSPEEDPSLSVLMTALMSLGIPVFVYLQAAGR